MAQESKTSEKQVVQAKPVAEDLSRAIEQAVEKEPDEQVKSVRVFGDCYRCNWWVQGPASHVMFGPSTGKIRRSRFLRANRIDGQLVIEDLSIVRMGGK